MLVRSLPVRALLVVGLMAACASPAAAADQPLDAPWTGDATVVSNGTTSAPRFEYAGNWNGSWTFTATAGSARSVPVAYQYDGFHSWYGVTVGLQRFVRRGGAEIETQTLAQAGPVNCCSAPSGGFSYTGTTTFDVQPGDVYGFRMSGSNGDSDSRLLGTLRLKAVDTTAPELTVPAGLSATTQSADGAAVTFAGVSARDAVDPSPQVTCDPASGTTFPVGRTTVTCTAADATGNTSAPKTFDVTVTQVTSRDATLGGSVAPTLGLTLGAADLGTFVPGVTRTYETTSTATVISSAGDAQLTVADPDPVMPGRLRNGAFALATPLDVRGGDQPYAALAHQPRALKTYAGPVSNDVVALGFRQAIASTDPLRSGTYARTLTFTLSTTAP